MYRRWFLAATGVTGLAGCIGSFGSREPRFMGPTEEDPDAVDIRYRAFTEEEVRTIRAEAREIPYDDLLENNDDHVGDPVVLRGNLIQIEEHEDHFVYRISVAGDPTRLQWVYASWTGGPFEEATSVTFWGEVLGVEVFTQAMGEELTVPAIAIADIERTEG